MTSLDRRQVLTVSAAAAGAAALAACGGSGSTSGTSSAAASSGAAPSTSAAPSTGGGAGGTPIAKTADVPEGGGIIVEADGAKYAVTQPTKGQYACFSAVCPHQGCNCNAVTDGSIVCPCHGSRFSIKDGAVQQGPATSGLTVERIEVSGTEVLLQA